MNNDKRKARLCAYRCALAHRRTVSEAPPAYANNLAKLRADAEEWVTDHEQTPYREDIDGLEQLLVEVFTRGVLAGRRQAEQRTQEAQTKVPPIDWGDADVWNVVVSMRNASTADDAIAKLRDFLEGVPRTDNPQSDREKRLDEALRHIHDHMAEIGDPDYTDRDLVMKVASDALDGAPRVDYPRRTAEQERAFVVAWLRKIAANDKQGVFAGVAGLADSIDAGVHTPPQDESRTDSVTTPKEK